MTNNTENTAGSDCPSAPCSASFPEVYEVDLKSWQFRREYLKNCLTYPFHFFRAAPVSHWHRLFISTHNVASSVAVSKCALANQGDIWTRSALLQRFAKWGKRKEEELSKQNAESSHGRDKT